MKKIFSVFVIFILICIIYYASKVNLVETMTNIIPINISDTLCDTYNGSNLEKKCNTLTRTNCNLTTCCIWNSQNKCKAGNQNGALFNTDNNGKTINEAYFYYQNKCYGDGCPL